MCILFVVTDRRTAVTFVTECLFCVCVTFPHFSSLPLLLLPLPACSVLSRVYYCYPVLSCVCVYYSPLLNKYSLCPCIHCPNLKVNRPLYIYIYHYSTIYY